MENSNSCMPLMLPFFEHAHEKAIVYQKLKFRVIRHEKPFQLQNVSSMPAASKQRECPGHLIGSFPTSTISQIASLFPPQTLDRAECRWATRFAAKGSRCRLHYPPESKLQLATPLVGEYNPALTFRFWRVFE